MHVDPVDLLDASHQPLQVLLADQGQGESLVVVPASTAHSVQVDVEVDIRVLL